MKEKFENPKFEIIEVNDNDVITESGTCHRGDQCDRCFDDRPFCPDRPCDRPW